MIRKVISLFSFRDRKLVKSLRNILGFTPHNIAVYKLSFTQRSGVTPASRKIRVSNERLEYLGDAILGAVVADLLFKKFPYKEEGFLTEMRSKIVSRENLNKLGLKLGLDKFLLSEDNSPRKRSMVGDAFEAFIGAVYLDQGYERTRRFIINRIIRIHVDLDSLETLESNFKSRLIEWCQKERKNIVFEVVEDQSAKPSQLITVQALVDGEVKGTGVDFSKKKAEQLAAEKACELLGIFNS